MNAIRKFRKFGASLAISSFLVLFAVGSKAQAQFGTESMIGDFVISAQGGFVSVPPPPFPSDPLRFNAALVGRLTFDGTGQVYGEWTVVFHNVAIPFGVRSRFEVLGSYSIAGNGHLIMQFQEFKVEPPAADDGVPDANVTFECYVVQRHQQAQCVLHTLASLQQGSDPIPEPVTLAGSLLRQQ